MKQWLTAAELAALKLPGMPATVQGVNAMARREGWQTIRNTLGAPLARRRQGRGGGWEYHYSLLPGRAQARLVARDAAAKLLSTTSHGGVGNNQNGYDTRFPEAQSWFERLPDKRQAIARRRLAMLDAVMALKRGNLRVNDAVHTVAEQNEIGASTLYAWLDLVAGLDRSDWLPALAPRHLGRTATVACDPRAWEFIKADYLRLARPSFESCYARLQLASGEHGWTIPSHRTLFRRIGREIPKPVVVLLRRGEEALKRMYPPEERDRTMFHALEAVNADGHKWDVFVRWPDGEVGRPVMVAIQDLYSNKILGWRIDRTENADTVRLAFGDVLRHFGVPDHAWLDNGRGFASKWITGGAPNRYRFKVKPEEPSGLLTGLGIEVHWTKPYSGQSKPIERAFRDFCDAIAKHPAFEGAYTGNKPEAKPENYGSKAIPIETFLHIVDQGIRAHNARPKRNTRVCQRQLSFDEAFDRSYADSLIRKAGDEQLRRCLLAAEQLRADRESGAVRLLGNRYWAECLHDHVGALLTVRFDPDYLQHGVHCYRQDGAYIGFADCVDAVGFADAAAAREHARKLGAFKRATREAAHLEKQLSLDELVRLLPDIDEPETPQPSIVRMARRGSTAAAVAAVKQDPDAMTAEEVERAFGAGLRIIEGGREEI